MGISGWNVLLIKIDNGLKIKEDPHTQAIENVSLLLTEEFLGCSVQIQKTCWVWAVPDILVALPTGKYLVVEVERTYATKFKKYLDEKTIEQIRWYDLECNLVGEWVKWLIYMKEYLERTT